MVYKRQNFNLFIVSVTAYCIAAEVHPAETMVFDKLWCKLNP